MMATRLLVAACAVLASALPVTFRNDVPRLDVNGDIVDSHDNMILAVNGTFYMYGERWENHTALHGLSLTRPQIWTYTSPDMSRWTPRGPALQTWPGAPYGTHHTPWVVYNKPRALFVLWFNFYPHGCCKGNWAVATSTDGVHFALTEEWNQTGTYPISDCTGLFVDPADGRAYLAYSSESANHTVSIEVLSEDYTYLTGKNLYAFPDTYVEGSVLFKQGPTYFVGYGSCCCYCRGGTGWVVHSATALTGPWSRQEGDLNCEVDVSPGELCGTYGDRAGSPLTIPAQGVGLSLIPLVGGGTAYVWHGERWLSAPGNNPNCPDECEAQGEGECAVPPAYVKGHGFSYWAPLQFHPTTGAVLPFAPFTDAFTLDVDVGCGMDHLPGPRGGG